MVVSIVENLFKKKIEINFQTFLETLFISGLPAFSPDGNTEDIFIKNAAGKNNTNSTADQNEDIACFDHFLATWTIFTEEDMDHRKLIKSPCFSNPEGFQKCKKFCSSSKSSFEELQLTFFILKNILISPHILDFSGSTTKGFGIDSIISVFDLPSIREEYLNTFKAKSERSQKAFFDSYLYIS